MEARTRTETKRHAIDGLLGASSASASSASKKAETVWDLAEPKPLTIAARRERWLSILACEFETEGDAWAFWFRAMGGVTLAAALYGLPMFIIGALFGAAIAGSACLALAVPCAALVRLSTGKWRHRLAGQAFGGLVGFVSTVPVWPALARGWGEGGAIIFTLGPLLATALGQVGGFLANRDYCAEAGVLAWERRRRGRGGRFSIRTMLIVTAWLAGALTVLELAGQLQPPQMIAIAAWAPWQFGLLWMWARMGKDSEIESGEHSVLVSRETADLETNREAPELERGYQS
jgi:hypothetical protein